MFWVCVLRVYGFRNDHFVLNNQLPGSSLGKTHFHSFIHPCASYSRFRVVSCHTSPSTFVCLAVLSLSRSSLGQPYCWGIMSGAFLSSRRSNLTSGFLVLWLLQPSHHLSFDVPRPVGAGFVLQMCMLGLSALWPVWVFCNGQCLLQREASAMWDQSYTNESIDIRIF